MTPKTCSVQLKVALAGVGTLLLAACAPPSGDASSGGGEDGDGPVRVGFIAGLTGTAAGPAADMQNGFDLYWEGRDNEVAGREVETFIENDEGKPEVGLSVAKRLVESENVDVIVGPHFAHVGSAVAEYLGGTDTAMIYPIPASSEFLVNPIDSMFLAAGVAPQFTLPLGKWATEQGHKTAVTISSDYTFGHEIAAGFANSFVDNGGTITEQIWVPLGTADYGPFASQLSQLKPDIVFNGLQAQDAVVFQQAWEEFGLDSDTTQVASLSTMDQSLLRTMKGTSEGTLSAGHFAEGKDSGETKEFVDAYKAAYDDVPGYYAASGYFGAQLVAGAIESMEEPNAEWSAEEFITSVRALKLEDSVFGPVTLDENGNVNLDVYIREVVEQDGEYINSVVDTIPAVSPQFEYDYDEFIAGQPWTRDKQGWNE